MLVLLLCDQVWEQENETPPWVQLKEPDGEPLLPKRITAEYPIDKVFLMGQNCLQGRLIV